MYIFGCTPTITKPTRIHNTSATLIYNIFTSSTQICVSGIFLSDLSHHNIIFIFEETSTKINCKQLKKKPDMSDKNIKAFCAKLKDDDWDSLMKENYTLNIVTNFMRKQNCNYS